MRDSPGDEAPKRGEWAGLLIAMAVYAGLFFAYYPPISAVQDEVGYINQALVWSQGAVTAEGAGWPDLIDFDRVWPEGPRVATRQPGRSLVVWPFVLVGGVHAAFASGLVVHLTTTAVAAAVLGRLGRSPLWGALVLCHPTLAIYSRTIMADEASGLGPLLAGWAVLSASLWAGVWAGLAVGLGALMRYHAGLALPIVAASFVVPPDRPRRWRDATLCLLTGTTAGGLIVVYNLALYGGPTDPFPSRRGYFALEFLAPHVRYYGSALLLVWPGMLLAPVLDRTRLRWLVRGCSALFLGALLVYYFHDRAPSWVETLVLGQRLLQTALPLWIVSYAGVIDDWVAAPLGRRLGRRASAVLVAVGLTGLLAGTGMMFARHQRYLERLRAVRDEVAAHVPTGALVLHAGSLYKLLAIPTEVPAYRLRMLEWFGQPAEDPEILRRDLEREAETWYLAVLLPRPGAPISAYAREIVDRFRLESVPVRSPLLALYAHRDAAPSGFTQGRARVVPISGDISGVPRVSIGRGRCRSPRTRVVPSRAEVPDEGPGRVPWERSSRCDVVLGSTWACCWAWRCPPRP